MSKNPRVRIRTRKAQWLLYLLAAAVALACVLWSVSTAFAQDADPVTPPASLQVISVDAWNNVVEPGDQFYLAVYNIRYTTADARPAESTSETMVLRLADVDGAAFGMAVPVPYVYRGYVRGISGLYYRAADANQPPWSVDGVFGQLVGNPGLTWRGGQPVSNQRSVVYHPSGGTGDRKREVQRTMIADRLRAEIPRMEVNWFNTTGAVTDLLAGSPLVLTASGEEYVLQASPHQRTVTPSLYSFNIRNPDILSFHEGRLTGQVDAGDTTIDVADASDRGFTAGQVILLMGGGVDEEVKVVSITGDTITIETALVNGYAAGSEVWVVKQSTQTAIDERLAGSFIEKMRNDAAAAFGMSPIMFGILAGMVLSLGGGGFVGVLAATQSNYGFMLGAMAAILIMLMLIFVGVMHVAAIGLLVTLVMLLAIWIHMWK